MPELMLRYRTATLFARLYAPELTMGIQTDDEVIDIAPVVTEPTKPKRGAARHEFEQAAAPAPTEPEKKTDAANGTNGTNVKTAQDDPPKPKEDKAKGATQGELVDESTPQKSLGASMEAAGVTFDKFTRWLTETDRLEDATSFPSWTDLPTDFVTALLKDAKSMGKCVTRCRTY